MKSVKKVISIMLMLSILAACLSSVSVSAMSIEEGRDNLRTLWSRGNGPLVNDLDIDYSYYSPIENGADNTKKYPLVIIMAGALEGLEEGFELTANSLASWTAEEYQSRFNNGAAYLLIGRAPEESELYWDSSKLVKSFKAAIDDFCDKNKNNVDKDRIYIIGWCLGGNGAINLSTAYPEYFAATMIMCPNRPLTKGEAKILSNMPLWYTGCKKDSYSNYKTTVENSFNRLKTYSNRRADIRLTSYEDVPDVYLLETIKFIKSHNLWENLAADLHYDGEEYKYEGMKTIDGNGNIIEDPYAISWLSSYSSEGRESSDEGRKPGKFYKFFAENMKTFCRAKMFNVMLKYFAYKGWI